MTHPTREQLFHAAAELKDPAQRRAFLDAACAQDAQLRAEIEELLQHDDAAGSFLQEPAVSPERNGSGRPITEGPGTIIGPYKLLQQIGEGGFGVVFMAEQTLPMQRKVALKILKPGIDTAQVVARFEAERQALALMDHPNIAKVLDAGSTAGEPGCVSSGRPYFVMELVKGVPITHFCDENQLTPHERLELFIPVCQAVQHAHQKGIIHRDLKPSNVLVALYDDQPVPKVIDFGVAKATSQKLTERTLFTAFGSFVGTLQYMSPEQAKLNALDIDTRSDIYALGVLLYELLTGNTPLEQERLKQAALDELLRIIREEEPPKPSTRLSNSGEALATISARRGTEPAKMSQLLRGELDWIIMKALEKDRTRRYETANSLARDLQHYLADEPVEACPPTARYRLRKFARKNKRLLASAAGFGVLLLLGIAASVWQAVRATQAEVVALTERDDKERARQAEAEQRDEARTLNDRLQRTLYAAHMNLGQLAWDAGSPVRVRELLGQHGPKPGENDLRGFEWYYLYHLCHAEQLTLKGHTIGVVSVAFSPDGKRLASGSREAKVWDAQTGQELLTLQDTPYVSSVVFSPDGKRLAGSCSRAVIVWDAQTGQEVLKLQVQNSGDFPGSSVVFSPDGKRLACASTTWDETKNANVAGEIKVWDAQTGQEFLCLKGESSAGGLAYSPDGKRLVSGDDKTVKVWDAETGQKLLTFKGHSDSVWRVAFSPDGERLASCSEKEAKVWDAKTGQELFSLKGCRQCAVFSPDGKLLGSCSDKEVKVWSAETGQELVSLKGHEIEITSVVFSPDGKRLASASYDGTVKVWDAQAGPQPVKLQREAASSVASVAFGPDGKRLASGGGSRPGSGPGELKVWDAQTGQEVFNRRGHTAKITAVAYSPDGKHLASASEDKTINVWDAQTGQELLAIKGHSKEVNSVAYSPDGKRLASASGDNTVKVWDAQTGKELLTCKGHGHYVKSVAFSPDGKCLASAGGQWDVTVKLWDAETGQELFSLKGPYEATSVAFSPDGKRLASGGGWGNTWVKVWDTHTGEELLTCKGHIRSVGSVVFSPDGKRLVSTGGEGLKVWDAESGQELLTMKGGTAPVAVSPDGHWLATGSSDGTLTIWDATPLPEKR